jgi:hypothetical protein
MQTKHGIQNESVFSGKRIKPESPELRIAASLEARRRIYNAFVGPVVWNRATGKE